MANTTMLWKYENIVGKVIPELTLEVFFVQ